MSKVNDGLFTSNDPNWTTPKDFYADLNQQYGFVLDAAALQNSTLVFNNWYGPDHPNEFRRDALVCNWFKDSEGGWIFLNPPYGKVISQFMKKANQQSGGGSKIVCLVPARTDTKWWHDSVIHHKVVFIKGRLRFGESKQSAPFPSALVIMEGNNE